MPQSGSDPASRTVETRISRRSLTTRTVTGLLAAISVPAVPANISVAQQATIAATPIACPGTTGIQLVVTPNPVRVDEPFDIFMYGLEPNQRVLLKSSFQDSARMDLQAMAIYKASSDGYFKASSQRPESGTFDAPDAMGFVWGALGTTGFPPGPAYTSPPPITIRATDADDHRVLATVQIDLTFLSDTTQRIDVREDGLIGTFFMPKSTGPTPAVLVFGGSEGVCII